MFAHHKKGPEALKFEFNVTVKSMVQLPSKYKHLRLSLTRNAKSASTKEIFAVNQHAEPSAADGTMKMVCTMYRGTPGSAGISSGGFEEKTYKLSLMRINPRAMREKEKKIGSSYINLSEYCSLEQTGIGEELKITMKVSESSEPAVIIVNIRSAWLKNYKGGDGDTSSDISGMNLDTASQATSHASLNSIEEEEEEEDHRAEPEKVRPSMIPEKGETPVTKSQTVTPKQDAGRRGSSAASASPVAVGGFDDAVELKKKLVDAQADLEWQQETVRDLESALTAKEEELEKVNEKCRKLQADMDGALRVQEELMQENERAESQYSTLLQQIDKKKKSSSGPDPQVAMLMSEIDKVKKDMSGVKEERDKLKRELQRAEEERNSLETSLDAERKKVDKGRRGEDVSGGERVSELEAALERERAKAAKYKNWLEKMTETKGAVESELAALKAGAGPTGSTSAGSTGGSAVTDKDGHDEMKKLGDELERVAMQLVTASLGHAQAEQDRLEAKQQVYRLKDANRKLRERLTAVELELAQAKNA